MNSIPIITTYLDSLYTLIRKLGASASFATAARANVECQIYAYLSCWNDVEKRNALHIIGLEEGMYYAPRSHINPFVVVTIRNSMLETLNSDQYKSAGLSRHLRPDEMKRITQHAIRHFDHVKFETISMLSKENMYGTLAEKYPLAWEALCWLGNCDDAIIAYEPIKQDEKPSYAGWSPICIGNEAIVENKAKVVLDGYSLNIDERLEKNMMAIRTGDLGCIYFDSFKMLTRNIEKLLFVINYVLDNEGVFVTANYFIANGYIERRATCLRPTSTYEETFSQTRKQQLLGGDIGKVHKKLLETVFAVV